MRGARTMNEIQNFNFNFNGSQVRALTIENEPC